MHNNNNIGLGDNVSVEERLKGLEVAQAYAKENRDAIQRTLQTAMDRDAIEREKLIKAINELEKKLDKQNTFVGGIVFAVSGVWAVILVAVNLFNIKL